MSGNAQGTQWPGNPFAILALAGPIADPNRIGLRASRMAQGFPTFFLALDGW